MHRKIGWFLCIVLLTLLLAMPAAAQEFRYGAGIVFDRGVPVMGFQDRYPTSEIYGLVLDYRVNSRTTMEFEYHHMASDEGKIEDRAFLWPIDKKQYLSPQANSRFNLNSFLINALAHLRTSTDTEDLQLLPYIAIGAGYYDYQDTISGLIYPGQKLEPIDTNLLLDDRSDDHTALGANLGLGMTVVQGRYGLDIRGRYNLILGDLRPMEAWGLDSVFPITMIDVRTTFKVYW